MNAEIKAVVQKIRDKIVARYYSMGLNASGNFDRQTVVEDYAGGIKITSPAYVYQMEDGRRAGSFPPIGAIKRWIQDKNANAGTDIPLEAAYAIAYTIQRDGIQVPNEHNAGNVVSAVLNPETINRIALEVTNIVRAELLTILTKKQ